MDNFFDTLVSDDSEKVYLSSIRLLQEVKLTQGNTALNSTLRRHRKLSDFLIQYQKNRIHDLEEKLDEIL